ncbi:hypothetical protein F4809DRAFT_597569 [Biscogniauxia mediterranea]|nr:hypothetical protein F4809DRAFT_597569 [Biscogniauxia mediterranea]
MYYICLFSFLFYFASVVYSSTLAHTSSIRSYHYKTWKRPRSGLPNSYSSNNPMSKQKQTPVFILLVMQFRL